MKCQLCQTQSATVSMNLILNQQQTSLHLCSPCFSNIKQPNGFSTSIEDFLQQFNVQGFAQNAPKNVKATPQHQHGGGFLDHFGRNLTAEAKLGKIDKVIGREEEIERMIEVLCRRSKNNPVLIGEAGVGKTAIAEGFALRIANGQVPTKMKNKQVYSLDLSSLVAGTSYRGQFEERMKELVSELEQNPNIIIFIDEIHTIVGAGSASDGSMDAGNILKPALARGELQLIGATTLKEYRLIEKDPALERRFQPVIVKEPTVEKAIDILKGLRPIYEQYHNVRYSDDVLEACVTLSHRYIQDRYLPDKAIDLVDEVGAKLSIHHVHSTTAELEHRLEEIKTEKQTATIEEDYEKAALLRDEENEIFAQLHEKTNESIIDVTVQNIQELIEKRTGIPVKKLQKSEQAKLKDLQQNLMKKVIGQHQAVEKVSKAIKRSRAGLKPKQRPISFMFVGPTGVGKTELTKSLAEELFGNKDAMIRLDMSEFMEKHSVSKLIGSPPGYVGYDEGGQLTEKVRRNPYSIILLDEVEKAHPDVHHMFLQILEDGRLSDSQGRVVTFKETIIIMTSNAGVGYKNITVGFGKETQTGSVMQSLGSFFKPEFLNRLDVVIEFNQLSKEDLLKIVDVMLSDLQERLQEQDITLSITDEAKAHLAKLGYDPEFGARPMRRVIQDKIEDEITEFIINEEQVKHISITLINNEIHVANSSI
ncbi:ATP-dependent Clp protease ATP-binding subunit [Bacillus alkalicellulosilyticus]|uniref:ATP-dependent Clp protease ATP-binding subunit n=1 Tax=Alkalihalobacterium alkalicellulosilyticum TaxID=1912214 RepID=UPI0009978FEF|nr:ATP-dependent Clp protease ATP-binding subunit [Bacillus alkalicellulosilyticus]